MNANTAMKINEAIDQAVRCGESITAVESQVRTALGHALRAKADRDFQRASREVFGDVQAEIRRSQGI